MADKLVSVLLRIQGVEGDTKRLLNDLATLLEADNAGNLVEYLKASVLSSMDKVEQDARDEIQEVMEPSSQFLSKKRKTRELDDFLDAFGSFLNSG